MKHTIERNPLPHQCDHHRATGRSHLWLSAVTLAIASLGLVALACAAPISIPNANFSDPANNGSVGGGLIGASGSAAIGNGPWHGTYSGVLGILAPPTLTIDSGGGTIGGLAGIDALGIVNNSGYFSQVLSQAYLPQRHYILSTCIDAGIALNLGVLNNSNAGLALTQGGVVKASTSNASPSTVTLSLVDGTKYRLTLTYDTGVSASGDIGVRAFSAPQNLITANLLSSVTFSAISLSSSAINPVAAAVGSSRGTPQGATVGTAFAAPFQVTVLDDAGDPVPNVTVTFSAPTSGPSATLAATTATTDANGQAHVTGVANSIAGNYTITATVDGVATPAVFELNNIAGSAATVGSAGGTPQDATVTKAFATSLGVTVLDASNNPVSGITVIFTAPDSGASASFPNGATANTDGSGHAQVDAVANTVAGNYVVTASVHGAGTTASFALTNVAGPAAQATPSSGTPQSATVSTAFDDPLGVAITDAYGNPISGATVTFSVHPNAATGAGAVFPPDQTTIDVITDSSGLALVGAIANEYPGSYQIVATGDGLPTAVAFNLTNAAAVTPHGDPTSGGQQSANANAAFSCLLQLKVTSDGTTPMPGVSIDFVAPTSGPSATLSDGTNNGTTVTEFTDVNGLVAVTAQANAIPGQYAISAGVTGSGTSLASYTLTNFPAGERIFGTGFEQLPAVCP